MLPCPGFNYTEIHRDLFKSFEKKRLLIFVLPVQVTDSSAVSSRKLYLFSDLKIHSFTIVQSDVQILSPHPCLLTIWHY